VIEPGGQHLVAGPQVWAGAGGEVEGELGGRCGRRRCHAGRRPRKSAVRRRRTGTRLTNPVALRSEGHPVPRLDSGPVQRVGPLRLPARAFGDTGRRNELGDSGVQRGELLARAATSRVTGIQTCRAPRLGRAARPRPKMPAPCVWRCDIGQTAVRGRLESRVAAGYAVAAAATVVPGRGWRSSIECAPADDHAATVVVACHTTGLAERPFRRWSSRGANWAIAIEALLMLARRLGVGRPGWTWPRRRDAERGGPAGAQRRLLGLRIAREKVGYVETG